MKKKIYIVAIFACLVLGACKGQNGEDSEQTSVDSSKGNGTPGATGTEGEGIMDTGNMKQDTTSQDGTVADDRPATSPADSQH